MLRNLGVFAIAVMTATLAGCWGGGSEPPVTEPTSPVTGKVTIDGTPEAGVRVMLFPAATRPEWFDVNTGAPHQGTTDEQGNFKITTYYEGDGAPAGEYVVIIYWLGHPKVEPFGNPDEPAIDPKAAKINKKYGNYQKPALDNIQVAADKPTDVGTLDLKTK